MDSCCLYGIQAGYDDPFFSICIPCYNVGDRLLACLLSIAGQVCRDYEVIIVDDGSERPIRNADYHELNLTALKVLRIENSGPYIARRTAFNAANGKVIICVDADDGFLHEHALGKIKRVFEIVDPDVAIFNATRDGRNRFLDYGLLKAVDGRLDARNVKRVFATNYCLNSLWSKAFKRSLLSSSSRYFDRPRLLMAEDRLQSLEVICNAKSFALLNEPLYLYRENGNSTTHSVYNPEYFFQSCYVEDCVLGMLDELGAKPEEWASFYFGQVSGALRGICCNRDLTKSERHDIYERMNNEDSLTAAFRYGHLEFLPFPVRLKLSFLWDRKYALLDLCMFPRALASFAKHALRGLL